MNLTVYFHLQAELSDDEGRGASLYATSNMNYAKRARGNARKEMKEYFDDVKWSKKYKKNQVS